MVWLPPFLRDHFFEQAIAQGKCTKSTDTNGKYVHYQFLDAADLGARVEQSFGLEQDARELAASNLAAPSGWAASTTAAPYGTTGDCRWFRQEYYGKRTTSTESNNNDSTFTGARRTGGATKFLNVVGLKPSLATGKSVNWIAKNTTGARPVTFRYNTKREEIALGMRTRKYFKTVHDPEYWRQSQS